MLNDSEKSRLISGLTMEIQGSLVDIEDLCLSFEYLPPSKTYGFQSIPLVLGGGSISVTNFNVHDYYEKMIDFYFEAGIKRQMRAFKEGFNRVFPISKLSAFDPHELLLMLNGEGPKWTREELLANLEPKLGYDKSSRVFLELIDVLVEMSGRERKAFLQFVTGSSCLPAGGIKNLHPRLTVVKRVLDSNASNLNSSGQKNVDLSLVSCSTCTHYLKLPEYSSKEILREHLLMSICEKGFYLN